MLPKHISDAKTFVANLPIPEPHDFSFASRGAEAFQAQIVDGKSQALVVGSDLVAFTEGVTAGQRQDIVNSALLAQLAANKAVSDQTDVIAWHNQYFRVLGNIGWAIQERNFETFSTASEGFEAHKAILDIAATLIGPNVATIALIKSALDALRNLGSESPWITLFNRESKHSNTARFQVTLAEEMQNGQFLVSLMAFTISAQSELTQILFFKFRTGEATLKHMSGRIAINETVLAGVREDIERKLALHAADFVRSLPDL